MKPVFFTVLSVLLIAGPVHGATPAPVWLGITLGSTFSIPACNRGEDALTKRYCHAPSLTTRRDNGTTEYHVFFPRKSDVPYARGEMLLEVKNGKVRAFHVNTWGIEAQGPAMDALTAAFGKPQRSRRERIRALRSRLPSEFAEWDFPGHTIRFDGSTTSIDWGRISFREATDQTGTTPSSATGKPK